MQRYFITDNQLSNGVIHIHGDDAHHIKNVMRQKVGEQVICILPPCHVFKCTINKINSNDIILKVEENLEEHTELPIQVVIAHGLPKGEKVEWVLQKGTELGMSHYIPLKTERSIVKLDEKKEQKKLERWGKIVKEAAEQSYRNVVPSISPTQTISTFIKEYGHIPHKLIAYEETAKANEEGSSLTRTLKDVKAGEQIVLVVGPEGGLSKKEVDQLMDAGFVPCALGPRILRTETAPMYFLSAVSYELDLKR